MTQQAAEVVQVTERDKLGNRGKRVQTVVRSFSLYGLLGRKRSIQATPSPSANQGQELTLSANEEEIIDHALEVNSGKKEIQVAEREAATRDQGNLTDKPITVTSNQVETQSNSSNYQDIAGHQSQAPLQEGNERDLWGEAWKRLEEEEQNQLKAPWKSPSPNNSFGSPQTSKEDTDTTHENNKHNHGVAPGDGETGDRPDMKETVEQVINKTKQKLRDYQAWPQTNTTAAAFRRKAKEVLVSALTVKDFLDVGMRFEPTGYGACAWTVVSFALTLINNDLEQTDRIFEASRFLSNHIAKYHRIQKLYQQARFETADRNTAELEDAIIETYVAILSYSAAVKKAADGSFLTRVRDSFAALTGQPLEALKETVKEKDQIVEAWITVVDSEYEAQFQGTAIESLEVIKKKADGIVKDIQAVQGDTRATKEKVQDLAVQNIIAKFIDKEDKEQSGGKHQNLRDSIDKMWKQNEVYTGKSGQWLINHGIYTEWKVHPQSVLWLQGPASCGKSSLCSSVIEDLRKSFANNDHSHKILVFWYFQATNSLQTIGRSFLQQLCKDKDIGLSEQTWHELDRLSRQNLAPTWEDLVPKIERVIKELDQPIFIVLDGLDELPRRTKAHERDQILKLVTQLIKFAKSNIHLLFTSRLEHDIFKSFQSDPEVKGAVRAWDVETELVDELRKFVDKTMENDKHFKTLPSELKDEIKRTLLSGKEKYFPWVAAMLDDLRRAGRKELRISERLKRVPTGMVATYQQALANVNSDADKQTIKLILMWMLRHQQSVHKHLTEEQLAAATATVGRTESLAGVVKPLVGSLLRTSESTLHLIGSGGHNNNDDDDDDEDDDRNAENDHHHRRHHPHRRRRHHDARHNHNNTDGNHDEDLPDDDPPPRYFEFIHSSAKEHLEEVLANKNKGRAETQWFRFSDESAHSLMAARCLDVLLDKEDKNQPKKSPLRIYAAQYWNKHYLFVDEARHGEGKVKLLEAKDSNLEQRVAKLLEPGSAAFKSWLDLWDPDSDFVPSNSDMESNEDEMKSDNETQYSADDNEGYGDDDDYDEDDNYDDDDYDRDIDSMNDTKSNDSIHKQTKQSEKPRADPVYYVVKLQLLRLAFKMIKNKTPHRQPGKEGTVLQMALYHRHWDVADALLEHCDDAEACVMARALIAKGARPNGPHDGKFGSPLHVAAYRGNIAVVDRLLKDGKAKINLQAGMFGTALQAAAASGNSEVVMLLLKNKAETTAVSGLLGTALQAALTSGDPPTIKALQKAVDNMEGIANNVDSGLGWGRAIKRLKYSNKTILEKYVSLFPIPTDKDFQMPTESDLNSEQDLIARILDKWFLPQCIRLRKWRQQLVSEHPFLGYQDEDQNEYPYESPAMEHLKEVLWVLPNFEESLHERELNRLDFRHKALFWSGINYILESLPLMIQQATERMEEAFSSTTNVSEDEGELLRKWDTVDNFGFRVRDRHLRLPWSFFSRERGRFRSDTPPPYLRRGTSSGYFDHRSWYHPVNVDMDLSDKLALETVRQQQLNDKNNSNDGNDHIGDVKIHLVVDRLLSVVKDLVQFGKLCDRLQATATERLVDYEDETVTEMMQDLTFEVFAALMRLAVSVQTWGDTQSHNTRALEQTVRLINAVRVPRFAKLAASLTERLQPSPQVLEGDNTDKSDTSVESKPATLNDKERDNQRSLPPLHDAAAEITAAAERLAREHLLVLSSALPPQETGGTGATRLGDLSHLVSEEVAPLINEFREKMCKQIGDLVHDAVQQEKAPRKPFVAMLPNSLIEL